MNFIFDSFDPNKLNPQGGHMKSSQAPHEKLTEEEMKEIVCDLAVELHDLAENIIEEIRVLGEKVHRMKKHLCPEKFRMVHMQVAEMSDSFKGDKNE